MKTNIRSNIFSFLLVFSLALSIFFLIGGVADARTSRAMVRVAPGGLSITAPADISMGEIPVDVVDRNITGLISNIVVADLRGNASPLGWSAVINATKFVEDENPSLSIGIDRMRLAVPLPGDLPPGQSHFRVLGGGSAGVRYFNAAEAFIDSDGDGVSNPISLMSAPPGSGAGQYSLSILFKLTVPAFTPAGNYTTVLTETVS